MHLILIVKRWYFSPSSSTQKEGGKNSQQTKAELWQLRTVHKAEAAWAPHPHSLRSHCLWVSGCFACATRTTMHPPHRRREGHINRRGRWRHLRNQFNHLLCLTLEISRPSSWVRRHPRHAHAIPTHQPAPPHHTRSAPWHPHLGVGARSAAPSTNTAKSKGTGTLHTTFNNLLTQKWN